MEHPIPIPKIQAWLFDLDGTLMDTDDQTVESLARRLRYLGKARASHLARRVVMLSETPMNAVITMLDTVGLDAVLFGLRRLLRGPDAPTFRIIDGVPALLVYLAPRGHLAVVTTRSHSHARAFLQQHALTEYFELLVTQQSTWRLKPHPAPILYAVEHLNIPPDACVMVGDTPVDIIAARRAGVWAIGVLCGFGEENELRRAGAHVILPSTADILPWLQENYT